MKVYRRAEVKTFKDRLEKMICDICEKEYKNIDEFKRIKKTFHMNEHEIPGTFSFDADKAEGFLGILFYYTSNNCCESSEEPENDFQLDICGECCVEFLLKIIRKYKKKNSILLIGDEK